MTSQAKRDAIIARVSSRPELRAWNVDGGIAAVDFMRHAAERNERTAAEADASLLANVNRARRRLHVAAHHGIPVTDCRLCAS